MAFVVMRFRSLSRNSQAAPRPRRKRSQVVRACDWCRKHRVKCDSHYPCSNCANRGGECSNETMKAASLPLAHREIDRLRLKVQELELELRQERAHDAPISSNRYLLANSSLSPPALSASSEYGTGDSSRVNVWGGIRMSTARSPHKTWYGPSSLFYFIGRINNFLDGMLQQPHSADHMLLDSSSRRLDEPTATPEEPEPTHHHPVDPTEDAATKAAYYLSPTQEEYFLDLFWQSYHTSLFPILDEAAFKEHYRSLWTASGNTRKPSALVDIVVAMCMQYGMSMLPAVKQQQVLVDNNNDAAIAGRWHYRRSQALLARELESPTVPTLQCHLLCCVYLCCGSFQNMADSACGLAVRAAYMLGLHLDAPQTMAHREREMRKRLWWALYVLDSKIGMKLGRPFLLPHLSNATPSLPGDHLEAALQSGSHFAPLGDNVTWLSFSLQQSKLFRAARTVHTAFYDKNPNVDDGQTIWDDQQALASHAEFIGPYLKGLDEWAAGVPVALTTKRQNNAAPFSTDGSAPLDIEQLAPLWLQRQRLLLELMYHNLSANLYRPFISFGPAPPSTVVEEAAIQCALHAMAVTKITHQVLSTTAILAGWHEAFQLQWNAALTLVGFVLSHPHGGVSTAEARKAIDLSVAVFDIFSDSFAVATSAAKIMRDLGAKVDFLKQQQQQGQGNASLSQANEVVGEGQTMDNVLLMPDISTMSKTWDGALSFDDLNAASMQDVFSMAFAVDEWSNLDSLWPKMDQIPLTEY
ncbi:fungal-specific transcription factor domain-containing protein [Chaetomidium leptoderma]|uniref:Fungal-specific transcription factor domain-containing protein n=1 Tax=Chaetomidium leptoderma TaxID=669021 RepID=A0AAN6ZW02_9PEZI|nr:fungal-specific transcription factor domain-containing protein [Chaetomidium leptoderma]